VDAANSSVSFRPVRIRRLNDEDAIVSSGVRPGEQIVALGAQLLHQGSMYGWPLFRRACNERVQSLALAVRERATIPQLLVLPLPNVYKKCPYYMTAQLSSQAYNVPFCAY